MNDSCVPALQTVVCRPSSPALREHPPRGKHAEIALELAGDLCSGTGKPVPYGNPGCL